MNKRNRRHRFFAVITVLVLVLTMLASGVSVLAFAPAGEGDKKLPAATETNTGGDSGNNDTAANGQDNSTAGGTGGSAAKSGAEQTDAAGKDSTGADDQQQGGQSGTAQTDPVPQDRNAGRTLLGAPGSGTRGVPDTWAELKAKVEDSSGPEEIVINAEKLKVELKNGVTDSIRVPEGRTVTIKGQSGGTTIL